MTSTDLSNSTLGSMAEYALHLQIAQNYDRPTINTALAIAIGAPGRQRPGIGDVIGFYGTGNLRLGRVVKLGRTRVTAEYMVPSTGRTREITLTPEQIVAHQVTPAEVDR